jgi:hypothetical protein
MAVQSVIRTAPQQIRAVQVSNANSAAINALFDAVNAKYRTTTQKDAVFAEQGGTRITVQRDQYPDQFAYAGDWIVVYDADHTVDDNGEDVWTTSDKTEIQIWGIAAGLPGTADDFAVTFTAQEG